MDVLPLDTLGETLNNMNQSEIDRLYYEVSNTTRSSVDNLYRRKLEAKYKGKEEVSVEGNSFYEAYKIKDLQDKCYTLYMLKHGITDVANFDFSVFVDKYVETLIDNTMCTEGSEGVIQDFTHLLGKMPFDERELNDYSNHELERIFMQIFNDNQEYILTLLDQVFYNDPSILYNFMKINDNIFVGMNERYVNMRDMLRLGRLLNVYSDDDLKYNIQYDLLGLKRRKPLINIIHLHV